MSIFSPRQLPINNGLAPTVEQGPRVAKVVLHFTSTILTFTDDFAIEGQEGLINNIQGVYIDNSLSDATFSLTISDTGHNITVVKATQGYFPIFCAEQVRYVAIASGGTNYGNVNLFFYNIPLDACSWVS
jgi:hypothetical protein